MENNLKGREPSGNVPIKKNKEMGLLSALFEERSWKKLRLPPRLCLPQKLLDSSAGIFFFRVPPSRSYFYFFFIFSSHHRIWWCLSWLHFSFINFLSETYLPQISYPCLDWRNLGEKENRYRIQLKLLNSFASSSNAPMERFYI